MTGRLAAASRAMSARIPSRGRIWHNLWRWVLRQSLILSSTAYHPHQSSDSDSEHQDVDQNGRGPGENYHVGSRKLLLLRVGRLPPLSVVSAGACP